MKKTYKIVGDNLWEMSVEIDHIIANPWIKNMVEFWGNWESKLENNNGDYTITFLKMLAAECMRIAMSNPFGSVESQFNNLEGWCSMDGKFVIKIIDVDDLEIDEDSFDIYNKTE